jgi:hypothetical protein
MSATKCTKNKGMRFIDASTRLQTDFLLCGDDVKQTKKGFNEFVCVLLGSLIVVLCLRGRDMGLSQ